MEAQVWRCGEDGDCGNGRHRVYRRVQRLSEGL